ncbi:MAG: hypothetical protein LBD53_07735 [Tannerella sp.]|jgi:hypothetical protein|nr:hypothetical protein [Tannerella sp.]
MEDELLKKLFVTINNEDRLPDDFNRQMMTMIRKDASLRKKRQRLYSLCGYIGGGLLSLSVYVYLMKDVLLKIKMPDIKSIISAFPLPSAEFFNSPSFTFSLLAAALTAFLLVIDYAVRRKIDRK